MDGREHPNPEAWITQKLSDALNRERYPDEPDTNDYLLETAMAQITPVWPAAHGQSGHAIRFLT